MKIQPTIEEFRQLAKKGNLVPVWREILADTETPVSAYLKLDERPSFLLESVEGGEKWARYSFIGLRPRRIIKGKGRKIEILEGGKVVKTVETDDPIGFLKEMMAEYRPVSFDGLPPFYGGLVGYLSYDMVRFIETLPDRNLPAMDAPDIFLQLTDSLIIFDGLKQTVKVLSNVYINGQNPDEAYHEAVEKINDVVKRLKKTLPVSPDYHIKENMSAHRFVSSFETRHAFEEAVKKSKEYIMAGDVFQLVLSQRFEKHCGALPFDTYRALRVINPSPYMYFLDTGEMHIIGSSPEVLVRLTGDVIKLRPIAGTRGRGRTEDEDTVLESELKADEKERAEHIMLVDLGRNDVGRVAKTGTVKVTELMGIEKYSHVMHMVSNVEGKLQNGLSGFEVLKACFPAGTVTGSPKIRAMEIIEELEPVRRGPYAGSVGYFGYSGNMDFCITIRTLIAKGGIIYVQAGAGIVADSKPELEYNETVNKAMGMMKAVDMAEEGLD